MSEEEKMRKRPKSVIVYNQLLQMILDGTYQQGDKLPGETQLAGMVGVSRMTLRQAINLLCEDGIIESRKGSGNFVKRAVNEDQIGIERMESPLYKCCKEKIDTIKTTYAIVSGKEYQTYFNYIFQKPSSVVLSVDRYYYGESQLRAYSLSTVSMDFLSRQNIEIDNQEEIETLLETEVYKFAYRVSMEVKCIPENEFSKDRKLDSIQGMIVLFIEVIFDNRGEIILYNKYYIPTEYFEMRANFYNR